MTDFSKRIMDEFEDDPEELEALVEQGLTENPSDYYFVLDQACGERSVVITPKRVFDEEGHWSDSGFIQFLLEPHLGGYSDLMESVFETPEDLTDDEVRDELISRGFEENVELLQAPVDR